MPFITSTLFSITSPVGTADSTNTPAPSAIPLNLSTTALMWVVIVGLFLAMAFVLGNIVIKVKASRRSVGTTVALPSVVRSWIAIALVIGLIIYTGATLGGQDESVRSALVGGLVAAVASATAYFFATIQAEGALNAVAGAGATPNAVVPSLTQLALSDALSAVGATNFKLVVDAASVPTATTPPVIASQDPAAGASVPANSEIVVKLGTDGAAPSPGGAPTPPPAAPVMPVQGLLGGD
jgi:hypothetical protein